jgi:hypothetical protein
VPVGITFAGSSFSSCKGKLDAIDAADFRGRNTREAAMLGIPLHYLLKHPVTGVADLLADPIEAWTTIREAYVEKRDERRPQCPYEPDLSWEKQLHEALGIPLPCNESQEFLVVWQQVMRPGS